MNLAVPLALISVCKSGTCPVIKDVALTQHKYDKVHVHLYFPANITVIKSKHIETVNNMCIDSKQKKYITFQHLLYNF